MQEATGSNPVFSTNETIFSKIVFFFEDEPLIFTSNGEVDMKIEEATKAKFRNLEHKTAVNLIFTAHWLEDYMAETLKAYELTHQQFNVLRILRGSYPNTLTQREIRERMIDKMPDVSRMIDKLKYKNLVVCLASTFDKRNCHVTISERGLELLSSIDLVDKQIDKLFSNFTNEELQKFNDFMDKLRR